MLGITLATRKWKQYLLGREFIIKTDHKPLKHFLEEQRLYMEAQHAWLLKLLNYKYTVEHKKGKENGGADSLSRRDEVDSFSLLTVVAVESNWINQVKEMVNSDDYFEDIQSKLNSGKLDSRLYQQSAGLIYYKGRILINPSSPLTQLFISEYHDIPQGGHSGYEKLCKDSRMHCIREDSKAV